MKILFLNSINFIPFEFLLLCACCSFKNYFYLKPSFPFRTEKRIKLTISILHLISIYIRWENHISAIKIRIKLNKGTNDKRTSAYNGLFYERIIRWSSSSSSSWSSSSSMRNALCIQIENEWPIEQVKPE